MELHFTGLACTQHFTGTAQFHVPACDFETVSSLAQYRKSLPPGFGKWRLVQQHTTALPAATTDTAAQLVQLRQPQPFRIFNNHQRSIWHIDTHFNDCCCHQQVQITGLEGCHQGFLFRRLQPSVHQSDTGLRQTAGKKLCGFFCRLALQNIRLFNQRAHPVSLLPPGAGLAHRLNHFITSLLAECHGFHRLPPGWQLVNHRGIQIRIHRHRQCARDRCCRHHQLVRALTCLPPLVT